jgi:hypothetical protein
MPARRHARNGATSPNIVKLQSAKDANPTSDNSVATDSVAMAKQLFEHLVAQGLPPADAWRRAGELLDVSSPFPARNDLVRMSQVDYSPANEDAMATATKQPVKRRAATHNGNGKLTRAEPATGTSWAARVARGLRHVRETAMLTIPKASEKFGIPVSTWYRVEGGTNPETTAVNIDQICEAIGKDLPYLYNAGKAAEERK